MFIALPGLLMLLPPVMKGENRKNIEKQLVGVVVGITRERDMEEQMLLLIRWISFVCRYGEIQINAMVDGYARGPIKEVFIKLTQREARVDIWHSNDRRSLCVFVLLDVIETWSNEELE